VAARAGRQAELPVLPRRKRPDELPAITEVALWLERRGKVLAVRRRPGGLYGGLWELPQGADAAAAAAAVGLTLRGAAEVRGHHRQLLSHRRLELTLATGAATGRARLASDRYDALRWIEVTRLDALGVSSATAALLAHRPALGKARGPG